MLSDFQTTKVYLSPWLKRATKFKPTLNALLKAFNQYNIQYNWIPKTNDYWVRDFMPIPLNEKSLISYHYTPDYLKKEKKYQSNPQEIFQSMDLSTQHLDLILDGGNVVKSSSSVVLTEKIFYENPNFTKHQILAQLEIFFQTDRIIIIPWDRHDICGHADGMLRFINEDTVLLQGFFLDYPSAFQSKLKRALHQKKLNIKYLNFNKKVNSTNWAYLNFLQTKDIMMLPSFGKQREDEMAFNEIANYFPSYAKKNAIVQIPLHYIHQYGGAFNCISWTV